MVEIKLETGQNATGIGKTFLYTILAIVLISAIMGVLSFVFLFYLTQSGFFAP